MPSRSHLGTPLAATRIERWDVGFYTERLRRERYSVDQEAFRPYFPPEESLRFVMRIAERMLGIRYTPVPATLWHEDVRAFAVSDAKTGKALATLYVDLYPREGKFNHAAVWPLRSAATRDQRLPQAALVVNMDRKGLTLGELETLLHEIGPRAAQQPVGDALCAAVERERAMGLRRGAVADARGLGLRQEGAEAVRRGLPCVQAGA